MGLSAMGGEALQQMTHDQGISFQTELKDLLQKKEHLEAASRVAEQLGYGTYHNRPQAMFSTERIQGAIANRPVYQELLPRLFQGIWATTNFDRAIESLCGDIEHVTPLNDYDHGKIKSAMRSGSRLLLKLHGDIDDPEHLVFTNESYDTHYANDRPMPKTRNMQHKHTIHRIMQIIGRCTEYLHIVLLTFQKNSV